MILALTQPQLMERLVVVDSTPLNTPVSIDRWDTLVKACRQLSMVSRYGSITSFFYENWKIAK